MSRPPARTCDICQISKPATLLSSAVVAGKYYPRICPTCLGPHDITSSSAGYERRRQYEDNAQDTVQPYTATGPNKEFLRLYPRQARQMFKPADIARMEKEI